MSAEKIGKLSHPIQDGKIRGGEYSRNRPARLLERLDIIKRCSKCKKRR